MGALIRVLAHARAFAHISVLSSICSRMCPLLFAAMPMLSYVCFQACGRRAAKLKAGGAKALIAHLVPGSSCK